MFETYPSRGMKYSPSSGRIPSASDPLSASILLSTESSEESEEGIGPNWIQAALNVKLYFQCTDRDASTHLGNVSPAIPGTAVPYALSRSGLRAYTT